jgi:UDP-N-acetylglucosamine 4,6-dehydratase
MSTWKNKTLCITGGTGSFGKQMLQRMLSTDISEIRIFSRDESKQDSLRSECKDSRVRYIIGDVRDAKSVERALSGVSYVFHAAALKQVPSCEFFPQEAVATNVIGSANVLNAAVANSVESIVCLSTDKAVYPINAMGQTKALMEKTAQAIARQNNNTGTRITITRYGNVMMSRGSVIPIFLDQARNGLHLTLTNPKMTRFMMSLEESVELVLFALQNGENGDLFVQKAPAATMENLANAIITTYGNPSLSALKVIGVRHGEKKAETLLSTEEMSFAIDLGSYFKVPIDNRSLDYLSGGSIKEISLDAESFTSDNTKQLNIQEIVQLLLKVV